MDRLSEINRPLPANRTEASDLLRAKPSRSEREERAERAERAERPDASERPETTQSRAAESKDDRERGPRTGERPERFSQVLGEQQAATAPGATSEVAAHEPEQPEQDAGDPAASGTNPEDGAEDAQPANEPKLAKPTQLEPKPKPQPAGVPVEPQRIDAPARIEASEPVPEIAAPELPKTVNAAPPALPNLNANWTEPSASVTTPAPSTESTTPASPVAPRVDVERTALEADGTLAKSPLHATEGPSAHAGTPAPRAEVRVDARPTEAPRETPMPRTAHEIERAADILRQVRVQITPQLQEARIQLQPVELGRVSIQISFEEGRARTVVRAERRETLAAIETHLPELRASLRQHGIDAQEFQLSLGFEERGREGEKPPQPRSQHGESKVETHHREDTRTLHAAVARTGVDLYA